jgi:hypothetical protein
MSIPANNYLQILYETNVGKVFFTYKFLFEYISTIPCLEEKHSRIPSKAFMQF